MQADGRRRGRRPRPLRGVGWVALGSDVFDPDTGVVGRRGGSKDEGKQTHRGSLRASLNYSDGHRLTVDKSQQPRLRRRSLLVIGDSKASESSGWHMKFSLIVHVPGRDWANQDSTTSAEGSKGAQRSEGTARRRGECCGFRPKRRCRESPAGGLLRTAADVGLGDAQPQTGSIEERPSECSPAPYR